jgi:AraC-like DNA-binding protein
VAQVIAGLDATLSRFVERVRTAAPGRGRARRVDRLPDGRTSLVFRVVEEGRPGDLTVVGPRTRALLKDSPGFVVAVMLDLKPGWSRPLLGVAAGALTDRFVALEDLWGRPATELCRALQASTSLPEMLDSLARAFALRLPRTSEPASARLARHAAALLDREDVRVDGLAERLGVTTRHLHRAFTENIGVGPKEYTRSVRLQRALRLAAMSSDWGRIAVDAGYYDQSHLIADFRDLVGLTPGAFLRRAREMDPAAPLARQALGG